MIKFLLGLVVFLLIMFVLLVVFKKIVSFCWQKMHEIAGIEVGTPPQALPYQPTTAIPNSFGNNLEYQLIPQTWQTDKNGAVKTKHGKISPMPLLQGLTVEKINVMPTEAVIILDRIHDKLSRYTAWQQENQQISETWLTEKKFVLDKLISETIPEAVNHYDQLARFNPHQLTQKIHHDMTAGDILIQVLLGVDKQIDELLDELNQQVSQKLATTYHYMKSRV